MSEKLNSEIAVIGIDIGKNSFHLVGQDRHGRIVLRQKWSRGQVEARLANLPPCLIGMEACTGAHHLSRKVISLHYRAAALLSASLQLAESIRAAKRFRVVPFRTHAVQQTTSDDVQD
jgi:transposase